MKYIVAGFYLLAVLILTFLVLILTILGWPINASKVAVCNLLGRIKQNKGD
jgi:hypothetical protein